MPNWIPYTRQAFVRCGFRNIIPSWRNPSPSPLGAAAAAAGEGWVVGLLDACLPDAGTIGPDTGLSSSTSTLIYAVAWQHVRKMCAKYRLTVRRKRSSRGRDALGSATYRKLLLIPGVDGVQAPENGQRSFVLALGHEELGTLREKHHADTAQHARQAADGKENLPRMYFCERQTRKAQSYKRFSVRHISLCVCRWGPMCVCVCVCLDAISGELSDECHLSTRKRGSGLNASFH